ncbi:MAG: ribosomal RNA small subunit methyltransferase A [Phycisphaerae bacterium]|nr:ribosomal RNA small subunit methyltransferase A [Phycisphaerae bacterium]
MQTKKDIQALLAEATRSPNKRFGQCFLIDLNLMRKLLDEAALQGDETVLEVGPGTGSLSEELLARAKRVVAVEIDRALAELSRRRFAEEPRFTLIEGDVLAGKHAIAPAVLETVAPKARLVANLPYNIATPLVADCLMQSYLSLRGEGVLFESLTFTVQEEVALRLTAREGRDRGPLSVLVALLGDAKLGSFVPKTAFWPAPKVDSRIVRIDFDAARAGQIEDIHLLRRILDMTFSQRRKSILATSRARNAPVSHEAFAAALDSAGIDPSARADHVSPEDYLRVTKCLTRRVP